MSAGRMSFPRSRLPRRCSRSAFIRPSREEAMPHIIVKLWPGRSEQEKKTLAEKITRAVMDTLHYGEESVSVGFEEVPAEQWLAKVYEPDIRAKAATIYKKPGYSSI